MENALIANNCLVLLRRVFYKTAFIWWKCKIELLTYQQVKGINSRLEHRWGDVIDQNVRIYTFSYTEVALDTNETEIQI